MAKDAFDAALAGFRRWTRTTEHKLSDDPVEVVGDVGILLDLMRDFLGITRPAELSQAGLQELLLRVYPREVGLWEPSDAESAIPALRDFLAYLGERGEMTESAVRELDRELDRIGPRFTDAVMDADLEPWDDDEEEDISLKDALGLPDGLPPMRLPVEAELAATARGVPTAIQLGQLVAWLGAGRAVTENAELTGGDIGAAAAALGLGPADAPGRMRDLPRLDYLWQLALEAGFVELDEDETRAVPGKAAGVFGDGGGDDEALDAWKTLFGFVAVTTLDIAASMDWRRSRELDFLGHGVTLGVMLFLTGPDGLRVAEASQMIMNASTEGLPPASAAQAWQSWVRAHGDPVRMLLDQMAELGAVRVADGDDGELAWLTPLGLAAVRDQLVESGVEIPLLPPADQMTAADLIGVAGSLGEEEFQAETAAWLACREPRSAAADLLSVAAGADPAHRMLAVTVAGRLGAAAEPAWRDALGRVELRGYAKLALAAQADGDPPGDLELSRDERAWILTDAFATDDWDDPDDEAAQDPAAMAKRLREAVPPGEEPALFEAMARVPHPGVAGVLTAIGKYHPDKKIAKAARTAAYKAASRQAAQRR